MRRTRFGPLSIFTPPGVYPPASDTALLAGEIGPLDGASVLELCAGSGALSLVAAQRGAARVIAVDCSVRAILAVRLNARLNGLRVEGRRGDLWSALRPGERFDLILANPPYLPQGLPGPPTDDRWDAGPDGRLVLDRIIDRAAHRLRPGGRLVLVQSAFADISASSARLAANGLPVIHSLEHRGPLGPLAAARVDHLVRRGVLEPGDTQETLTVLTACGLADCAPAPGPGRA